MKIGAKAIIQYLRGDEEQEERYISYGLWNESENDDGFGVNDDFIFFYSSPETIEEYKNVDYNADWKLISYEEVEGSKIRLEAREVEYSCSPGGVDTWELYSPREELIYSSESFDVLMRYVIKNFAEYEITLKITSLKWYHKELERESA